MEEIEFTRLAYMAKLAVRQMGGGLTNAESHQLETWLSEGQNRDKLEAFRGDLLAGRYAGIRERYDTEAALRSVELEIDQPSGHSNSYWKWASAAAAILLLGAAWYFFNARQSIPPPRLASVESGGNGVLLTTDRGERIVLGDVADSIYRLGSTRFRQHGSTLSFDDAGGATVHYQQLSVPSQRTYRLELPDGSTAELNANSSIRFPDRFAETRDVTIEGEVYFDIHPVPDMPFTVHGPGGFRAEVLGTAFNVKAYGEVTATLLLGSIRVGNGRGQPLILEAGESATMGERGAKKVTLDTRGAIAWRGGTFYADDVAVGQLLIDISRWYGIGIKYADGFNPRQRIHGAFSHDETLEKLLGTLEKTGTGHFRIENDTVTCLP